MVASPTFCGLGGEKKEIKIRRKLLTEKREVSSISSLQGGQEKLLVPFSIPSCWWRKWGIHASHSAVLLLPLSSLLSLPPSISLHTGHASSREGAVDWTDKIITISSSPPFPGQLGKPPPYLEGGLQDPTPWLHHRQLGSWGGQRLHGAWVHPGEGCGPEMHSVAWRGCWGVGRGLPITGSCGGWRHFWKPGPPGPTSGPEKAPKRTKTKRQLELLMKPQASWLIWGTATGGLYNETWTTPWKGQVRFVPKRTLMRGLMWPNRAPHLIEAGERPHLQGAKGGQC